MLVKQSALLCTKMSQPALAEDYRWHQYLTLMSSTVSEEDQEELEWPLLLVASELQSLLLMRGIQWEIPLFERSVILKKRNGRHERHWKLLLRIPVTATWELYELAVKKALNHRKDCLVVQIRFERVVFQKYICFVHSGDYRRISVSLDNMLRFAHDQQISVSETWYEKYLNDRQDCLLDELETEIRLLVE